MKNLNAGLLRSIYAASSPVPLIQLVGLTIMGENTKAGKTAKKAPTFKALPDDIIIPWVPVYLIPHVGR